MGTREPLKFRGSSSAANGWARLRTNWGSKKLGLCWKILMSKSFKYDFQGWAVGLETVLSSPKAKFHFLSVKNCRNIVLESNDIIWSGFLAKFNANCPPLMILNKKYSFIKYEKFRFSGVYSGNFWVKSFVCNQEQKCKIEI